MEQLCILMEPLWGIGISSEKGNNSVHNVEYGNATLHRMWWPYIWLKGSLTLFCISVLLGLSMYSS